MKSRFFPSSDDLSPDEEALLRQLDQGDEPLAGRRAPSRVGPDAQMTGLLRCRGELHLGGRFSGTVEAGERLVVEPGADVRADVSAVDVIVNGRLRGGVHARRRLELSEHAEWDGSLSQQPEVLVIHEKARFGKRPT